MERKIETETIDFIKNLKNYTSLRNMLKLKWCKEAH